VDLGAGPAVTKLCQRSHLPARTPLHARGLYLPADRGLCVHWHAGADLRAGRGGDALVRERGWIP
jgi:hypothetical protein